MGKPFSTVVSLLVLGLSTIAGEQVATAQIPSIAPPTEAPLPSEEGIPSPPPTNVFPEESAYTLGAGDTVQLNIFNIPEYSGTYQVLVDGTLNLPLIGSVPVEGLTLPQSSELISQRYADLIRRPIVTLSLAEPRPLEVAIAGEINRPGTYTLTTDSGRKFPKVSEMIQQAGGITRSADVRNIQVRRSYQNGTQVFQVDLMELIQSGELRQDLTLRDGDTIFIPTQNSVDPTQSRLMAAASFAPDAAAPVEVAVVGEVFRPGTHTIEAGGTGQPPTVTQAIRAAGGITNLSDIRNVEVRRMTRNGEEQVFNANLWQLLSSGDLSQDLILQPGDRIVIPRAEEVSPSEADALATASFSPGVIRVNVVGEVESPGTLELPANTPLNQAILSAGGFNIRARDSEVELVRLNPDGTVNRREIPVDLTNGINEENNPSLRNNDVIVVGRSTIASVSDTLGLIFNPIGRAFSFVNIFDRLFD